MTISPTEPAAVAATEPALEPVTEMSVNPEEGRHSSMGTKGKVAASGVVLVVLVGGGLAVSHSLRSSSSAAATSQPGAAAGGAAGGPGGSGGFGGAGAPAAGTITAVSATSISVKGSSGSVKTYQLSSGTAVENNGTVSTAAKLTTGEKVVVFIGMPGSASATTSTNTASRILAGTSATSRGAGGPPSGGRGVIGSAPGTSQTGTGQTPA